MIPVPYQQQNIYNKFILFVLNGSIAEHIATLLVYRDVYRNQYAYIITIHIGSAVGYRDNIVSGDPW